MHITALVDGPDHVCCRYRVVAFRPHLERAGHTLSVHRLPRRWWLSPEMWRIVRGANVLLQRRLLGPWALRMLRRSARRIIFDFDDAVYLRDSYHSAGFDDLRKLRRFADTVRAADIVVCGNAHLQAEAQRFLRDVGRAVVVPTCVEAAIYPAAQQDGIGAELVWIGSSSTLQGLERVRPMLEEIGSRCPGVRLKLVCDRFLDLTHLPVVGRAWTEAGEAEELASASIGVSWVPNDRWSLGKCGLKVLQYMAAGLPVIANPVGVHVTMIRHGVTGFLASTSAEWVDAVRRLADDPELRRRMGIAGRRIVEDEYSVAAGARRWLDVLASLEARAA